MTLGGPFGRFSPAAGVAGGFAAGESPAGDFGEAFGSTGLARGGSPAGGFGGAFGSTGLAGGSAGRLLGGGLGG